MQPSPTNPPVVDLEQEQAFPLLEYLQVLWFRKRLVIAVTLFAAVLGFIHVNELKDIYTANSTMMIGVPEMQVVDIDQVMTRDFWGDEADAEIEVLRSRGLAGNVVERLGLLNHPEFNPALRVPEERFFDFLKYLNPKTWIPESWKRGLREATSGEVEIPAPTEPTEEEIGNKQMAGAIDILLGKLSLERVEWTNVIKIRISALDPVLAARVANELPEAYIDDQLQAKFDATRKATEWLTEQLEDQKSLVEESERAVEIYRETHGLTQGSGTVLLAEQLSELNSQLIVARTARIDLEARLEQVSRLLDNDGQGIESAVDVLASPLIQQLRSQEAEVTSRLSELAVELGPKHPRMLQVNAELSEIRQRIRAEIEKIELGLSNELDLARNREQGLEANLRSTEAQSGTQSRQAIQLRALEREAAANRALFETFLTRFKETSSTQSMQTSDSRIISRAEIPGGPSAPNRQRLLTLFILGGFMAGCALVFTLHVLHPGLLTPEQVEQALGVHVMGIIPLLTGKEGITEHMERHRTSAFVEALNSLKISLQLSDPDGELKVLQITSSVPEEGKSSLALALALTQANAGKRVLLVDADLRRGGIGKRLGHDIEAPGLTDLILAEDMDIEAHVTALGDTGLDFMRSGDARQANATDIFSSQRMGHIISALRASYDIVILDSPPVMAVADARIIGKLADKTLFVVRWDKTPAKVSRTALELLDKGGIPIVGITLQQVDLGRYGRMGHGDSGYYYHYGRYGQYYRE